MAKPREPKIIMGFDSQSSGTIDMTEPKESKTKRVFIVGRLGRVT